MCVGPSCTYAGEAAAPQKAAPTAEPPTLNMCADCGMLNDMASPRWACCPLEKLLIAIAVATFAEACCHGAKLPATTGLGAGRGGGG